MLTPLVRAVVEREGYPVLESDLLDQFLADNDNVVLFFAEIMKPVPEAADVAVILPELTKAFSGRFVVAVPGMADLRTLQRKYRFRRWPTLVFLRHGEYLGAISEVQDWSVYLTEVESILSSEPTEPPPFELPGVHAAA